MLRLTRHTLTILAAHGDEQARSALRVTAEGHAFYGCQPVWARFVLCGSRMAERTIDIIDKVDMRSRAQPIEFPITNPTFSPEWT